MSLERGVRNHEQLVNVAVFPTATYIMRVFDYVVRASNAGPGAMAIILPRVSEAAGRHYSILARQAAAANPILILDSLNDSECFVSVTLNAPCDGVLAYSDGMKWFFGPAATAYTPTPTTLLRETTLPPTTLPL